MYINYGKRVFDIIVSLLLLIILFPLFLVLAVLVSINLGSPLIFRQVRPGLYDKPFVIFKIRTMTNERDEEGNLLPNSERLTAFGEFLRKFSLDELPELYNVFKGDMSIVGPRPLKMDYLELYNEEQSRRHEVRPGLTGWAQVNGRNTISFTERFKMDVWYVDNLSFWLDLKIILLTILKVFKGEDVNPQDSKQKVPFDGTN